jgi:hypothetical protein
MACYLENKREEKRLEKDNGSGGATSEKDLGKG